MELWDADYLDIEGPAFIDFGRDRLGEFRFGAVHGWIDYRLTQRAGEQAVEFSWEGVSEGDQLSGRGWGVLGPAGLHGRLFIHNSDDSSFQASRTGSRQRPVSGGGA